MDHPFIEQSLIALLEKTLLPFTRVSVHTDGDMLRVDIESPEPRKIIGHHGETLNALQHLLKSMVRKHEKLALSPLIVVDTDGYRKEQEDKVCRMAEAKAEFVRRTGNRVALSPMSPYFRRIVHLHVANTPSLQDFATESIGEGDFRQVVLRLKSEKEGKYTTGEELSPLIPADDGLENLDV